MYIYMGIVQLILLFIGGMTVLLLSAEVLLSVSKTLAIRMHISPLIVALVVVALGTTIPELSFTISGLLGNTHELAMGNIVGSNISNILLIFGVAIVIGRPRVGYLKESKNALMMLVMTMLFILVRNIGIDFKIQGLILLTTGVLFLIYQYISAKGSNYNGGAKLLKMSKVKNKFWSIHSLPGYILFVFFIATLIGIATGSYLVINTVEGISHFFGISQTAIGLTLVAISTSMPELITTVLATMDDEDNVIVGTLIGSNIYNVGFYAGALLLNQSKSIVTLYDQLFLFISAFIFTFIILFYHGRKVHKIWGVLFLLLFLLFIGQALILPHI